MDRLHNNHEQPFIPSEYRDAIDASDELLPMEKVAVFLVLAGARPTTTLEFELPVTGAMQDVIERLDGIVQPIRELLRRVGLVTTVTEPKEVPHQPGQERSVGLDIFVGRTEAAVAELADAWRAHDQERIGNMLGFPVTAVEAYARNPASVMARADLPPDVRSAPYLKFLGFSLSAEHWEEELTTVQAWAETIQELAPQLYERITGAGQT